MSHGFIDDIPGHAEFWRRYECADHYILSIQRKKLRKRLLTRLKQWKDNIKKIKERYPKMTKQECESLLVSIETIEVVETLRKISEIRH